MKHSKYRYQIVVLSFVVLLGGVFLSVGDIDYVHAEAVSAEITNPIAASDFLQIVQAISNALLKFVGPIVVIIIIYSGVQFILSQGEPEKITKARKTLTYALLGLAIILIGYGFVTLIQSILNLGAGS